MTSILLCILHMCSTSVACSFVLVALIGVGIWQSPWLKQTAPSTTDNPGISGEKQPSNDDLPGNKAYPYDDKIQYLPKEMPVSKYENGFFAYLVAVKTEKISGKLGVKIKP